MKMTMMMMNVCYLHRRWWKWWCWWWGWWWCLTSYHLMQNKILTMIQSTSPHLLPLTPSLALFQPHWLPHCPRNTAHMLQPQVLCTLYLLSLSAWKAPFRPTYLYGLLPPFVHITDQVPSFSDPLIWHNTHRHSVFLRMFFLSWHIIYGEWSISLTRYRSHENGIFVYYCVCHQSLSLA